MDFNVWIMIYYPPGVVTGSWVLKKTFNFETDLTGFDFGGIVTLPIVSTNWIL